MNRAVIDTRHHSTEVPMDTVVAGLTLLERSLRLVGVCGCQTAEVIVKPDDRALAEALVSNTQSKLETIAIVEDAPTVEALHVRSSTICIRGAINDALKAYQGETLGLRSGPNDTHVRIGTGEASVWHDDDRFSVDVLTKADASDGARALWLDCRKPLDGMVSRHLNRYISLAISRALAPTGISPNHISVVTFSLGILGGVLCAMGGYVNFLLAGLVFQANSVIDGCDGELARVKYEFSVTGEWLDTLSDDLSDVFFWAGLGWGAYVTFPAPFGLSPSVWLWLAGISVAGKLISMALYYRWLIAHKRGDLLAFTWSFDDDTAETLTAKVLKNLKYLTKKDFIVFACMVLGFFGALPYMLGAAAPGNIVVAFGVIAQELANRQQD